MKKDNYNTLDEIFESIKLILDNYGRSEVLQKYFFKVFEGFLYANLINIFFLNLNEKNMEEHGLTNEYGDRIKQHFDNTIQDIDVEINDNLNAETKIDLKYYENFVYELRKNFQEISELVDEIEKEINLKEVKEYLDEKNGEIKGFGVIDANFHLNLITTGLKTYIDQKHHYPDEKDLDKLFEVLGDKVLPQMANETLQNLENNSKEMLTEQKEFRESYEDYLYELWEEPLDLLECLIKVSFECGEKHANILSKDKKNRDPKLAALTHIHARALQISNEILVLLKAGYPDGANARWRSLYELAVISSFLSHEENIVSERYLEHEVVRTYKDALDYEKYCKKMGYPPSPPESIQKLKKKKENICEKYGENFKRDWDWIPQSVLPNRNFRSLSEYVELDHLRPFYNLSAASVHGLSRGFYRLGLKEDSQKKILLCGPSDYGLADPIQNAAISLVQISVALLRIKADYEDILSMKILDLYIKKIGFASVKVQNAMDEKNS